MRIAFIGAGRMGRPVIDRMVAGGHQPTVLARRDEARSELAAAGLPSAPTIAEVVQDAEVVFCMVLDDQQVRDALLGESGAIATMSPGAILVQHTTCDPQTVELLVQEAARGEIRVLDAAVSGNPRDIADGSLTLWVGGDEQVLEEIRPLLTTYASPIMHVGPPPNGQFVKLVNQALFVAQVGLAVDAVRIGEGLGISEQASLSALQHGSGASRSLSSVAWMGVDAVGERLAELMLKDIKVIHHVAERHGIDLGLFSDAFASDAVQKDVLYDGKPPDRSTIDHGRLTPGSMKENAHG